MKKRRQKVTLEQGTSVNQMAREHLTEVMEGPGRTRMARARLRAAFEKGLVQVGDRTLSRDELHMR